MSNRLPQSLHDRAEVLARSHPLGAVAEILRVRPSAITVMRKRGWRAVERDPRTRPMPTDFAIQARHKTHAQLAAHYHAGNVTISRWLREKPVRSRMKPGPKAVRG